MGWYSSNWWQQNWFQGNWNGVEGGGDAVFTVAYAVLRHRRRRLPP